MYPFNALSHLTLVVETVINRGSLFILMQMEKLVARASWLTAYMYKPLPCHTLALKVKQEVTSAGMRLRMRHL